MLSIDQAKEIIIDAIEKKTTHTNYLRVCNLAKLYAQLITGESITDLLNRYERREDKEAFKQRVELTITTVEALSKSVINPFEKVLRTDPLVKRIESKDERNIDILSDKLMIFYSSENQNSGLDYWLQTRFKSLSFLDPNAFVVLEWDSFDNNYERASPYPYEIPASQAINFEYKNNSLQWILDKKPIKYIDEEKKKKDGFKFTFYGIGFVIAYERVNNKYTPQSNEVIWESQSGDKYAVREHNTLLDVVPVFSIGYLGDERTKEVTYVNPFHSAVPYFKKSINLDSEADLSKTLHAFPQKFQYVQACPGTAASPCRDGMDTDGQACPSCKGSGIAVHTSAQDAVYMPIPKRSDDMVDLDKLMVYKAPPIDLLKFQEEILDKYEQKIHATVFNTLSLIKKTTVATATERDQDMDNVYDTLHPFSEKITAIWSSIVQMIAKITETYTDDLVIDMRYPNDFKLKTTSQLIANLKEANDSGAPSFVRAKINDDIAEQTFVDQPEEFAKYQVKQLFYPFPGKTEGEVDSLLSLNLVPFRDKLLFANFERLFRRAEKENMGFWQLKFEKQEAIIEKFIDELEIELKPKPELISLNTLSDDGI
ncbi:hypothetical protein SMI01S_11750 [Sphingobacterium mizutaii NBRC 14946 = DSM 11724]|uniref:Uncharacterized protein n=2 Tax=Sphingobacterium mizutaii TaxID=1010 RepID=A0AAJ4XC75_9SPHI|nr:hypothetical protein [Sphingobacterium mizutaii]GEM67569.1 hypothetical protein SMI01S_11750 [Sphingobacterium mizutaii NBRC 14946 = DSM 11724]SDL14410.1 hypothetical protein SAMN05192578_1011509 [Sphingobacterium mizutaii]SNV52133.1 Uncharacterised protein [Sphingobacterium mizutaii]